MIKVLGRRFYREICLGRVLRFSKWCSTRSKGSFLGPLQCCEKDWPAEALPQIMPRWNAVNSAPRAVEPLFPEMVVRGAHWPKMALSWKGRVDGRTSARKRELAYPCHAPLQRFAFYFVPQKKALLRSAGHHNRQDSTTGSKILTKISEITISYLNSHPVKYLQIFEEEIL